MSLFDSLTDKPIYVNVYTGGKLGGAHIVKADADWSVNYGITRPLYRLVIRKKKCQ